MSDLETVALNEDWEFRYAITRDNSTTGLIEAAAGLTVTGWFSATDGGTAIGATTTTLSELSGKAGTYLGVLLGPGLTTDLTAYRGLVIYEVITYATGHLLKSTPVRILGVARPL